MDHVHLPKLEVDLITKKTKVVIPKWCGVCGQNIKDQIVNKMYATLPKPKVVKLSKKRKAKKK